jgi:hypothetical protein
VPFIGVLYPVSRGRISPESYRPTVVEWGVSIGLIAAPIFLFGLGARLMPVLPKEEVAAPPKGEGGLRIEYCDGCLAYLKTYDGEGSEAVPLADWTSLHLDLLARDRGLKRMAASRYEVEA